MHHWAEDAVFYNIYPLGLTGAPATNDFSTSPTPRLNELKYWMDHLQMLGVNALYLGPVFESTAHGYDTADYYRVDRRLGDNNTLKEVVEGYRKNGFRVILDGVFNHVGRDFWAFRDVKEKLEGSQYRDWFFGLDFEKCSPYGDPFHYQGWNNHYNLVKLNLHHPDVKAHLLGAVEMWIREFGIDGLRLDAADCLDPSFIRELAAFCRRIRPDFWLVGEIIHGDYRMWANPEMLDSVTNYECYKGLYSSHNDKNYFEIAYSFNRQFGSEYGLYQKLPLYAFADNHDVNRVASSLRNTAHLDTLYLLLMTMPGVPSVYYGSEWGMRGEKANGSDEPLRPRLTPDSGSMLGARPDLSQKIARLIQIRRNSDGLKYGDYQQLLVRHEQLAFLRRAPGEQVVVAVNASDHPSSIELPLSLNQGIAVDLLNPGETFTIDNFRLTIPHLPPQWGRILSLRL